MIRVRRMERREVVYRLDGIDPGEGVDVDELSSLLAGFGRLVRVTASELGCEGEVSVRVLPFRRGSFITEFVLTTYNNFVSLFASEDAAALANVLGMLGFLGGGCALTLPKVVRRLKGKVSAPRDNGDGTFTYGSGEDEVVVGGDLHKVLQSREVADLYSKVSVGPFINLGGIQRVEIGAREGKAGEVRVAEAFEEEDKEAFATYRSVVAGEQDMLDEVTSECSESVVHGIVLFPKAGPYDGGRGGYTFTAGTGEDSAVYRRVKIEDDEFRGRLESGEVRFGTGDSLKVDLRIIQKITKSGKSKDEYIIDKVISYKDKRVSYQGYLDLGDA